MNTKVFFTIIILSVLQLVNAQNYGELKDERDGQIYKTIKIGQQEWMAENLNFKSPKSWYYRNDSVKFAKYGRLYFQKSAMNACPQGWHLPSDDEWKQLEQHLGMSAEEADKYDAWRGTNQGAKLLNDKELGFNILLAGFRNPPANNLVEGIQAFFWTSTLKNTLAYMRQFYSQQSKIFRRVRPVNWAFSVRCVKNKD